MLDTKTINNLLNAEEGSEHLEAFYEALLQAIDSDDESWERKARQILLALQENNAHDLFVAICGWSATSIAEKAMVIRDECKEFYDEPSDGNLIIQWDDGACTECFCMVNPETHEVYDFDESAFTHKGGAKLKSVTVHFYPVSDPHTFRCIQAAEMPEDETAFWYKPIKEE